MQKLSLGTEELPQTATMPVLFLGHGSPMNAIEDSPFARGWQEMAQSLPAPAAILCVSAHWETRGTFVTTMTQPPTIHDFGGFPRALYEVEYPAPGSPVLAEAARDTLQKTPVGMAGARGLDHGCWAVLIRMYPAANVPIVQVSLDHTKAAAFHYDLGQELAALRRRGVLIVCSGNMVHNLRPIVLSEDLDFNRPLALDWALEADGIFKRLIAARDHKALANYQALGSAVQLAVATPEHYLPMLYALALQGKDEPLVYFNDVPVAGSLTMTCFKIG